jgi:hypothetical protein
MVNYSRYSREFRAGVAAQVAGCVLRAGAALSRPSPTSSASRQKRCGAGTTSLARSNQNRPPRTEPPCPNSAYP